MTTYAYDDLGRMSTETRGGQTRTYVYVMGSKLASVTGWGNTVEYGYAGDGKRNFRMLNSTVTASYKWDAGYNVVNEENNSGTLAKTYVVAPKPVTQASPGVPMEALLVNQGPVGTVLAEVAGSNPASGAYKYYVHDNLQSTRGLFEQNKSVAGTLEYTPYGENYTSPAPAGLTHRFTGLDLDATTGQYYAPYRYYAPNLSRWLTRDPLGMVDGTNMFAYVSASPTRYDDQIGLQADAQEAETWGAVIAACITSVAVLLVRMHFWGLPLTLGGVGTLFLAMIVAAALTAVVYQIWAGQRAGRGDFETQRGRIEAEFEQLDMPCEDCPPGQGIVIELHYYPE